MTVLGNVRPLTGYIGAEVTGLDLGNLDAAAAKAVWDTFLEYQVVFFRHQTLSADALLALGQRFGDIVRPHAGLSKLPDNPDVMLVETEGGMGSGKYNTIWHSDVSFNESPPAGSIIHAVKLPDVGGDTLFASMYAAYDNLSEPLKNMVEGLEAFHDGMPIFSLYLLDSANPKGRDMLEAMKREEPGAVHPVVRTHPETGRKALYVNRSFTSRILGLSEIESRNLLDLLCEHCEQSSFQVRWRWSQGDVGMWDNRCAMHVAAMDYGAQHRVMHRVTLKGDKPH